jgi:hypothetical protein
MFMDMTSASTVTVGKDLLTPEKGQETVRRDWQTW